MESVRLRRDERRLGEEEENPGCGDRAMDVDERRERAAAEDAAEVVGRANPMKMVTAAAIAMPVKNRWSRLRPSWVIGANTGRAPAARPRSALMVRLRIGR